MAEEKREKQKKKLDPLGIVLRVLLIIAAVLFCVLAVLSWPSIKEKGFHDTFFGSDEEVEIVRAKEIEFVANQKNAFAAYRDGFAVLSPSGLTILGSDGDALLDQSKSFANPVLRVAGDKLLAYDAGGANMFYIEKGKLVGSGAASGNVITASVNSSGWRLTITDGVGWKAIATALRPSGDVAYELKSAERYLTSGDISPDCTRIALGGVRQSNAEIISSVYIFELTSEEPVAFWETTDGVPTSVRFLDDGRIMALCESSAVFIDGDTGEELGRYRFGSGKLVSAEVGTGFVALETSSDGVSSWLVTLSFAGDELARRTLSGVIDVSANGDCLGVLTSDSVLVYNNYLESVAGCEAPAGGRHILLASDSAAYVLSANAAMLYEF